MAAINTLMTAPLSLSGKQARALRAQAHDLKPVIQIGKKGWSEGLRDEIDNALFTHELIKVRLTGETPIALEELVSYIETELSGTVVQVLGRILTVYRQPPANRKPPKIQLPADSKKADTKNPFSK